MLESSGITIEEKRADPQAILDVLKFYDTSTSTVPPRPSPAAQSAPVGLPLKKRKPPPPPPVPMIPARPTPLRRSDSVERMQLETLKVGSI